MNAVEYMHSLNIMHRDLKPENILIIKEKGKFKIKLIDFGLSNFYSNSNKLKTACGSPSYAAPEMLLGTKYDGLKADIWSLGIVLYAMVCGYLPFEDDNE